jgi:hypothetical protein
MALVKRGKTGIRIRTCEAKRPNQINYGLLERLTVDAKHEAQGQTEGCDGRRWPGPHIRATSGPGIALRKRRLQGHNAFFERRFFRPVSARCETVPQGHGTQHLG